MGIYIGADSLKAALANFTRSSAKGALFDFLVVKRTLKLSGGSSVAITEHEPAFRSALEDVGSCHWHDARRRQEIPFINVFSLQEKRKGFRTKKYPSNGTNTNVAGKRWEAVVELSDEKPRRLTFRRGYEKYLTALTNKSGKPESRPNLHYVALWVYRNTDLKELTKSDEPSLTLLADTFTEAFDLTGEELKALFNLSLPALPGIELFNSQAANPDEYLPKPPDEVTDEADQTDDNEDAVIVAPDIDASDKYWKIIDALMRKGRLNFMLSGPPGTSKTWYAYQLALMITGGNLSRIHEVQFHPSYGYEDFVQGMAPVRDDKSKQLGFELEDRTFVTACRLAATESSGKPHVLLIEEFSRGDASRIFGELLTLIEPDYRGRGFTLLSGDKLVIPPNLVVIGTMNPFDRSVSDIDDAMERRFSWIYFQPDVELLKSVVQKSGMTAPLMGKLITFFNTINRDNLVPNGIGHAVFANIKDEDDLQLLWNHSLRRTFERRLRYQNEQLEELRAEFRKLFTGAVELD